MDELKERVVLVQEFDKLCDRVIDEAVYLAENYTVEEESVMVEKKCKVIVPKAAS